MAITEDLLFSAISEDFTEDTIKNDENDACVCYFRQLGSFGIVLTLHGKHNKRTLYIVEKYIIHLC